MGKVHELLRVQNPPTPCPLPLDKGGEGGFEADAFTNFGSAIGITPTTAVEQHLQQVGVVHSAVAVGVFASQVAARIAKREHLRVYVLSGTGGKALC